MTIFYLSTGSLTKLYNRVHMGKNAIVLPHLQKTRLQINLFELKLPIVVKVIDISFFIKEQTLGIELIDSYENVFKYPVTLDRNKWVKVNPDYFPMETIDQKDSGKNYLEVGSIIIIKQYSFECVDIVDNEANNLDINEKFYLEDLLTINEFFIIGRDE
jgi:hypothetical protein